MKKPRLRTIFLIAVLLLAAGLAGLYFYLPAYVQNHLIPGLLEQSGISVEAVSIRRISIWGADLGIVKINGMDESGMTIRAIQVSYAPLSLLNKSIDTIELIGFSTDLKVSEDQICIAGFCISTEKKETKSDVKGLAGIDTSLPVQIERVKIQNGRLRLLWLQHELLIPFDIELLTNGLNQGLLEGENRLISKGQYSNGRPFVGHPRQPG